MSYGEPRWLWGCLGTLVMAAMLACVLFIVIGWPIAILTGNWTTRGVDPVFFFWVGGVIYAVSIVIVIWVHQLIEES